MKRHSVFAAAQASAGRGKGGKRRIGKPAPSAPAVPKAARRRKGDSLADRIATLAPEAVQLLHDNWPSMADGMPDGGYAMARGVVAEVMYGELATVRGMRVAPVELGADDDMQSACGLLRERIRQALPLEEITPDHFGCVHEILGGFRLVGGKLAKSDERRKMGAHYTPPELTAKVVTRTIEPLLACIGEQSPLVLRIGDPAVGAGAFPMGVMRMLAPLVLERGEAANLDEAKRLVAIHCCYGVDKGRYAVHSCKLALTLECRADRMPRTWLDDNIKCGDALVGLLGHHDSGGRTCDSQIATFDWRAHRPEFSPKESHEQTRALIQPLYDRAMNEAALARQARMASLTEMARAS